MSTHDLGLRQRKSSPDGKDKEDDKSEETMTEKYVEALSDQVPEAYREYVRKAAPYLGMIQKIVEDLIPIVYDLYLKANAIWVSLAPYKPELLAPAAAGLILCFFGGSFQCLIAAAEAFRMCGYETSKKCITDLYEDITNFLKANKEDDARDEDNDGVADTKQISKTELVTRKTLLFLRTVDPKRVTDAIAGLTQTYMSIVATLQLKFAKAITLGNAIGSVMMKPAKQYAQPLLELALPKDYKKWAAPVVEYTVKSIAVSFAFFVQRVISAFHSALRGGLMFSRNIMEYLTHMKIMTLDPEKSFIDEAAGYVLAGLGFFFQLWCGFSLPFPLNILLLPLSIVESYLVWTVGTKPAA